MYDYDLLLEDLKERCLTLETHILHNLKFTLNIVKADRLYETRTGICMIISPQHLTSQIVWRGCHSQVHYLRSGHYREQCHDGFIWKNSLGELRAALRRRQAQRKCLTSLHFNLTQ